MTYYPRVIQFGIPTIDELIGFRPDRNSGSPDYQTNEKQSGQTPISKALIDYGIHLPVETNGGDGQANTFTTSLCIVGPDGTGKSALAMHLASRYAADCVDFKPRILYASTDLSFPQALKTWEAFRLHEPNNREIPFNDKLLPAHWTSNLGLRVDLYDCRYQDKAIESYLIDPHLKSANERQDLRVAFINLQDSTAGDDWGFLNHIVSVLEEPQERDGTREPANLLIIDAVEGLEALVGNLDAYGQLRSRRSRVAQIIRAANPKCHIVLIVEEPREDERLPEEFIADVVIRMRRRSVRNYERRTIEIDKVRGQAHIRGQHPMIIRDGKGSTTGIQQNADDPKINQSYFHVAHSLHYINRNIMKDRGLAMPDTPRDLYASFGIEYLDNMLAGSDLNLFSPSCPLSGDAMGLPCSTVTALIGDDGTQKSRLGRAFLSMSFSRYAERLASHFSSLSPEEFNRLKNGKRKNLSNSANDRADIVAVKPGDGVSVFLTTQDYHAGSLAQAFVQSAMRALSEREELERKGRLKLYGKFLQAHIERRLICRRLEIHDISSPLLAHVINRSVRKAQELIFDSHVPEFTNDRYVKSWPIRVVIDDMNTIRDTYPDVHEDPLFVPFLMFYLGREGVTTLVIDTQQGRPDTIITERFNTELRALVSNHLYTWRVPFFGESRVAIAAIPPISRQSLGVVREFQWEASGGTQPLIVDPHFELYMGLEEGNPCLIPLKVRMFAETPAFNLHIAEVNGLFSELFAPGFGVTDVVSCNDGGEIDVNTVQSYDRLRDFCYLQRDTRLDHTLVFQVDEFWAFGRQEGLRDNRAYLTVKTNLTSGQPDRIVDPYTVFQDTQATTRSMLFEKNATGIQQIKTINNKENAKIDRVPFTWNFGFLLCRKKAWAEAFNEELPILSQGMRGSHCWTAMRVKGDLGRKGLDGTPCLVRDVWNALVKESSGERSSHRDGLLCWRTFLEACTVVAKTQAIRASGSIAAFDLSLLSPESLSCLVLEMWASEIMKEMRSRDKKGDAKDFAQRFSERLWNAPDDTGKEQGLIYWLTDSTDANYLGRLYDPKQTANCDPHTYPRYSFALYKILVILTEVLKTKELVEADEMFSIKNRDPDLSSVAALHWYTTACKLSAGFDASDPLIPLILPGHFSVRGDWFLAVASGSRSSRLGDRALDLLSSRRSNIQRLQLGLGLPARDIMEGDAFKELRTRLFTVEEQETEKDPANDKLYVKNQLRKHVMYRDILNLGALPDQHNEYNWFWRSRLLDYDRHARIWQKWICRVLFERVRIRQDRVGDWWSGFQVYDWLENYDVSADNTTQGNVLNFQSYKRFGEQCDFLISELRKAGPPRGGASRVGGI